MKIQFEGPEQKPLKLQPFAEPAPKPKKGKQPTPRDAGRLARKTADYLEDNDWGQGALEGPVWRLSSTEFGIVNNTTDAVCLSGALNKTYCGNAMLNRVRVGRIPLLRLTHELLDEFLGKPIEVWNDRGNRTKEEVIQHLRKFADEYDPRS